MEVSKPLLVITLSMLYRLHRNNVYLQIIRIQGIHLLSAHVQKQGYDVWLNMYLLQHCA